MIIVKEKEMFFLIKKFVWKLKGSKFVSYDGFHCGLCGRWVNKSFKIPEYMSIGEWWDTWGICKECSS